MNGLKEILSALNRQEFVSGASLAADLGISRAAVQQKMKQLVESGLPVTASPKVGYRLESGVSLLEVCKIEAGLVPAVVPAIADIQLMQSTASTNSELLASDIHLGRAKVCMAEFQSAGRGRRGNEWESAPYRNIMLSVSWGFESWPHSISALGLAIGLVVTEYLNNEYQLEARIKWPNDILIDGSKLAGILIDVSGEASGACQVVVGLGLNVHQPNWTKELEYPWLDLHSLGLEVDRNELVSGLISVITALLMTYAETGFAPMVDRWNKLSSYSGYRIKVFNDSQSIEGLMLGVDKNGGLKVRADDGERLIEDSSMSVRRLGDS